MMKAMGNINLGIQKEDKSPLAIKLFGEFEVWLQKLRLPNSAFGRPKTIALLKLMVHNRSEIFTSEMLAHHLFPELRFEKAIKNLHARISELRYALEPNLTRGVDSAYIKRLAPGCYRFDPNASVWVDTETFSHQLSIARRYQNEGLFSDAAHAFQTALKIYRGPFLAQDIYEEWTMLPRNAWKFDYENALREAAILHRRQKQFQEALACANKGLEQNPFNEVFYQEKMMALSRLGQTKEITQVYDQCQDTLQNLSVAPTTKTIWLNQSLRKHPAGFILDNKTAKVQKALLKGRFLLSKNTARATQQAYKYFHQATHLDAENADAHAGLADVHASLVIYHQHSLSTHCKAAKAEAQQALHLDNASPAAHTALALVLMNFEWQGEAAENHLQRALELDPSYLPTYLRLAALYAAWGDYKKAMTWASKAHEINPLSIETYIAMARIFYLMKDPVNVIDAAKQALELEPNSWLAYQFLSHAYIQQSESKKALHQLEKVAQLSGGATSYWVSLGHTYGTIGKRTEAERVITQLQSVSAKQFVSPYHLAIVFAGMQEHQLAVDQLEQARQQRSWPLALLWSEPRLETLRGTSVYQAWANRRERSAA